MTGLILLNPDNTQLSPDPDGWKRSGGLLVPVFECRSCGFDIFAKPADAKRGLCSECAGQSDGRLSTSLSRRKKNKK